MYKPLLQPISDLCGSTPDCPVPTCTRNCLIQLSDSQIFSPCKISYQLLTAFVEVRLWQIRQWTIQGVRREIEASNVSREQSKTYRGVNEICN